MFLRRLTALAALLLASCGTGRIPVLNIAPYRIEIQQGNFITQEMVSQLKPGMSKDQVRFILGTALVADSFHADRWDYVFRRQRVNSTFLEHRKIRVFFENGKLARIEGDVTPASSADSDGVKTPEARTQAPEALPQAPASGGAAEAQPAAQAASGASGEAQPVALEKPAAAPAAAADGQPKE